MQKVQEALVGSLGGKDPLEKEMATRSRKFHGQRSLEGYNPRGRKESDTTERRSARESERARAHTHTHTHTHTVTGNTTPPTSFFWIPSLPLWNFLGSDSICPCSTVASLRKFASIQHGAVLNSAAAAAAAAAKSLQSCPTLLFSK